MSVARSRGRSLLLARAAVAVIVALGAGLYACGSGGAADDRPARPVEGFDASGFAIWPEDTARAGLDACRERSDSEPWRLSAEATAIRFAREAFGWKRVDLGDDFDERADGMRVLAYGAPTRLDLGNLIVLFRYADCWFVGAVDYREGGPFPDQNLVRTGDGETLLELSYRFSSGSGLVMEAGYAGRSHRVVGNLLRVRAVPGETGHYLSTFVNKEGVTVAAAGGSLPVAPDLGAKLETVEHGGFAMYPDADEKVAHETCRRAADYFDYGRHAREPLISFAMDELGIAGSSDAPRIETSNQGGSLWIMRTPRLTLQFDTTNTTNNCVMLTDVTTPGKPIDARVSVGRDVVRVDIDAGSAETVELRLGFGDETSLRTEFRSPLFVPLRVDPRANGYYVILLRDERDRLIAAEGHALQSPGSAD